MGIAHKWISQEGSRGGSGSFVRRTFIASGSARALTSALRWRRLDIYIGRRHCVAPRLGNMQCLLSLQAVWNKYGEAMLIRGRKMEEER